MAGSLGYCGLDPRRAPLQGDEIRSCWETVPLPYAPTISVLPTISVRAEPGHLRDAPPIVAALPSEGDATEPRWSLFDD